MTNLDIYVNTSTSDNSLLTSGVNFTEIDVDNDKIIFTGGSDSVADGQPSPSNTQLNQAGILLTGSEIVISKYFLNDFSANELKQIHNMGEANKRYVFCFDFDGSTASEPVLELWDDTDMDSIALACLGAGTPSSSWVRGITTTNSLPGDGWTGSRLAGSSNGYFLWLNDEGGPLTVAETLYCQMKMIIPASQVDAGANAPIIAIKYATV
jgi:hypothetical protein